MNVCDILWGEPSQSADCGFHHHYANRHSIVSNEPGSNEFDENAIALQMRHDCDIIAY